MIPKFENQLTIDLLKKWLKVKKPDVVIFEGWCRSAGTKKI